MLNAENIFSLARRTVLITGASGYLGSAMARGLAEAGASVVVSSRSHAQAQEIVAELPVLDGAKHVAVAIDHMDPGSIEAGFHDAIKLGGHIDVLVANGHEPIPSDWKSVTAQQFNRQMQNASGYFLLARCLQQHVSSRGGLGSVILLGSMYGVVGSYPEAYEVGSNASPVAYHALKGGIVQMTRHLAVYWAESGIRVNCLSPGPFPAQSVPQEMVARLEAHSPMKRMGRPEELVGPVVFLASDASSYITGHNLLVDGGWTAW